MFYSRRAYQEERDNEYGRSKSDGRKLLEEWAVCNGASFTGMVVPNVFGPFGKPNYNSFIATFGYKLTHGDFPTVLQDNEVNLFMWVVYAIIFVIK